MKKVVKSLAITLALAMALSMVPAVNSYAAPKKAKNKVVYEFKNGTMTIKGKGKMPDSMRFVNNKKIKKVVIKKGVTYVSKYAFSGCKNLKSVKISNTVKEIGWHSFEGTKIKKITIPKSVKTIGNQAFYNCDNLKTITMPGDFKVKIKDGDEEVWEIMSGKKIKTINLNSKLKLENAKYFEGTKWNVSKKDAKYKSIDGVIYSKDGKDIVRVPSGLKELTIANGCETFNLQSVLYAEYVPDDGEYACCLDLEKITIPESVKRIDDKKYKSKYSSTYLEQFSELIINTKQLDTESIITLVNNFAEVVTWNDTTAVEVQNIAKMLPDRITSVGDLYILDKNILLKYKGKDKAVTIPEGIERIAEKAFYRCTELKEVNLPESLKSIGDEAFYYAGIEKIEIPKSVVNWGEYIFMDSLLKEAVLPENMTVIPKGLFLNCYELKKVNVPEKLTRIKADAFVSTDVDVQAFLNNKNLTTVEDYAFSNTNWTELMIPSHIKKIGNGAFSSKKAREVQVTIEGNTASYAQGAFAANIYYDRDNVSLLFKAGVKDYYTNVRIMSFGDSKKNKNKQELNIIWANVEGTDGYDIRVSSNKKFTKNVKKVTAASGKTAKTIMVSKKIKTAYVKIRPYKVVNGKKVYGRWATDKM